MSALNKKSFLTYLKEGGIYVVLLVLLAIIIFQDPTFLSLLNLSNILTQSSVRIIIALGVAGLIVTQGTDLSAGRQVGLGQWWLRHYCSPWITPTKCSRKWRRCRLRWLF